MNTSTNPCTCPSGDGSLRWPCPVHAPSVADAPTARSKVDALALVLLEAWKKAEPDSSVTKYPTSYLATFVDMARAALAAVVSQELTTAQPVAGQSEGQGLPPRWYVVDKDGLAMLCRDYDDAQDIAADSFVAWPQKGPHRVALLGDVSAAPAPVAQRSASLATLQGEAQVLRALLADALPWFEEAAADQPDPEALPHLQALRDRIRAALAPKPGALL